MVALLSLKSHLLAPPAADRCVSSRDQDAGPNRSIGDASIVHRAAKCSSLNIQDRRRSYRHLIGAVEAIVQCRNSQPTFSEW